MRDAIDTGLRENGSQARPYAASLSKLCILSMLGRWNTKMVKSWECCEASTRDDAPVVVHRERQLDANTTKYMTYHTTLTNQSMRLR